MATRAALITGGSSGIGLAIARALGEDGYGVTVSARRPDKLEAAAEELRGAGIEVEAVPANMAEEEDISALVAAHRERFGRLDVLVNNAGVGIGGAVADAETKKLDMQLDVNLRAVYLTTRECLPDAQGGGRRARQGADRQHRLDRRQVRPGLAGRLLGDQVRRGRPDAGAAQGARQGRHPGHRPLPGLRGHRR